MHCFTEARLFRSLHDTGMNNSDVFVFANEHVDQCGACRKYSVDFFIQVLF